MQSFFPPAARLHAGLLLSVLSHLPLCTPQLVVHGSPAPDLAPFSDLLSSSTSSSTDVISLPAQTVKILVCGDSISQGQEGDFTWRYRLWEWFRANNEELTRLQQAQSQSLNPESDVDPAALFSSAGDPTTARYLAPALQFVGPYNGTLPAAVGPAGVDLQHPQSWGAYHPAVDAAFSPGGGSAHFAVYGTPAWLDVDKVQARVAAHAPDVVVLHVGFNDFGWWGQTPRDLAESVRALVWNARLGRRDVRILVADVSQRVRVDGRDDIPRKTDEYNALLADKVREWTTPESPVVLVRVSEEYACHVDSCPAGVDGLHPNALGDFQIARAYSKVLHEQFRIGSGPLAVPPLKEIPGMKSIGMFRLQPMDVLMYPPVGIFMMVSLMSLFFVVALRPRWMPVSRTSEKKYHRLPITRDGMEGF